MIRLRVSISQVEGVWGSDVTVVIAGLTNTYSSYVTTFEEYAMQRYEGASTIFGPHTLDAYIQVGKSHLCKGGTSRVQSLHGTELSELLARAHQTQVCPGHAIHFTGSAWAASFSVR